MNKIVRVSFWPRFFERSTLSPARVPTLSLAVNKTLCAIGLLLWPLLVHSVEPAVSAAKLRDAGAEEWRHHGRTFDEQRFSPLDQINRDTVNRLGLAWATPTGTQRGLEATPLMVEGVLYFSTTWSRVMAVQADSGKVLWQYDPAVAGEVGRNACCDVVNRGVALWNDRVFVGALDGRLIALNRADGTELWSVQTTDLDKPYTITGAPRVVNNKVIIGNGGAEYGVRGYFAAYDVLTGEQVWRFYTVPGSAEGPVEHPELEQARRTWPADASWETGLGGTVWDAFAYDAQLNLLYVGVGNSSLYNRKLRSPGGGDNLFLASILAVNPDTGQLVWHYQTTPAEQWDYTATAHMILAELEVFGEPRKVLMQAPKNGFFYILDRATGELLSAENYVPVNWASHVDLETGRPVETGSGNWSEETAYVTPGPFGGHNWHPMAFSPRSRLVYIPTIHMLYPYTPDPDYRYNPATWNTGEDWEAMGGTGVNVMPRFCSPTRLTAWDPVDQQQVWEVPFESMVNAGVLATAGGLVFQGTSDGRLVAYADDTGEVLWSQQVGIGIMAPPMTYALNGVQYVSVLAGLGGAQGAIVNTLEKANYGHLFTFRLDGQAQAPELDLPPRSVRVPAPMQSQGLNAEDVEAGANLYHRHCARCHGPFAKASGVFPDLRTSMPDIHENWNRIVLDGLLAGRGMASFSDVLDARQSQQIHAYVIEQAMVSDSWRAKVAQAAVDLVCIPSSWLGH